MQDIREIDIETELGKYLLMAISKITSESQTDKTPNEVLAQLNELKEKVFTETYGSKGSDELSKVAENTSFATSSQTEISDEEIYNATKEFFMKDKEFNDSHSFNAGAKWYREQLKSIQ